jgi:pimeloyl-ACP methyl ester carboxylesterase
MACAQPRSDRRRTTFVLIHGAGYGGWCWKKLTRLLQAAGQQVFAPTLTGLGERSHLLTPEVDLDTHIKDTTNVLEYEDLRDVVLVGHSYGGMVIAGVAEKANDRLAQLVYLDAFLPEDGKAAKDYLTDDLPSGDGWRVPPPPATFFVTEQSDVAWVSPRLGDHPLKTFTQQAHLPRYSKLSLRQTFIQCTSDPIFAEAAARAKQAGFQYRELLSAGHMAMITQPGELAAILLNLL